MLQQKGGNPALLSQMYQINIFEPGSREYEYLNPVNGIIFTKMYVLENYFNYGDDSDNVTKLVRKLFHKVDEMRPMNKFGEQNCRDLGKIIGCVYYNSFINPNLNVKLISKLEILANQINDLKKKIKSTSVSKKVLDALNLEDVSDLPLFYNLYNEIYNKLQEIKLIDVSIFEDRNINTIEKDELYCNTSEILKSKSSFLFDLITEQLNYLKNNGIENKENTELNNVINKYFNKDASDDFKNKEMFSVLLSLVWWFSNNREGIYNYYLGLKDILGKLVKIPEDFIEPKINEKTFEDEFMRYYQKIKLSIPLLSFSKAVYKGGKFSDCGETSLRNFINIILYKSDGTFNIDKLLKLGAIPKLIRFYQVYDTINKHFEGKFDYNRNGVLVSARDAWADVVSELECVTYVKSGYEIHSIKIDSEHNMLKVLKSILTNIKSWNDFNKKEYNLKLNYNNYKSEVNFEIELEENMIRFKWVFLDFHYHLYMLDSEYIDIPEEFKESLSEYQKALFQNLIGNDLSRRINSKYVLYSKIESNNLTTILNSLENRKIFINILNAFDNPELIDDFSNRIDLNKIYLFESSDLHKSSILYRLFKKLFVRNETGDIIELNLSDYEFLNKFKDILSKLERIKLIPTANIEQVYDVPNTTCELILFGPLLDYQYAPVTVLDVEIPIPNNLTKLIINNVNINKIKFTTSLTHLTLGPKFNQYFTSDVLPSSITHLSLKSDYNYLYEKNIFPSNLTHLTLGGAFNQTLENGFLPSSLTHLTFEFSFNKKITKDVLPPSLTHLTFGSSYIHFLEKDVLPPSLTHLTFGLLYNNFLEKDVLPSTLTHLTFGNSFNQIIESDVLPYQLTHLTFGDSFNQIIKPGVLPSSLTHLTFGNGFNKLIEPGVLPASLTHLIFGQTFYKRILKDVLPFGLTHLTFGYWFDFPIEKDVLPTSLTHLSLGEDFNQRIGKDVLPPQIKYLKMNSIDRIIDVVSDLVNLEELVLTIEDKTITDKFDIESTTFNGTNYIYKINPRVKASESKYYKSYLKNDSIFDLNPSSEMYFNKYNKYKTKYLNLKNLLNIK